MFFPEIRDGFFWERYARPLTKSEKVNINNHEGRIYKKQYIIIVIEEYQNYDPNLVVLH